MSGARPAEILRQLAPPEAAGSDRELLRRFVNTRDQVAFAELVRRHGPVVLNVCRRVAGHPQDAEDAFQAVFLVLARKAASVSNPDLLGNWLYGVAVRVAQKARRTAARRRAREVQVTAMPDPPTSHDEPIPDIGPVLHEELDQLPDWYRDALILCDLRGVPRAEAAKVLGVPEGTLSSRLANGRKKLADRLARRGITLSVAAVPVVLGEGRAAVPDDLLRQTCGLVADWAAGGGVPGPVGRLAEGGFTVRKTLLIGAFAAVVTVAGVALAARHEPDSEAPPTPDAAKATEPNAGPNAAPQEKPQEKPAAFAAPKLRKAIDLPVAGVEEIAWSRDGKGLAVRDSKPRGVPGMAQNMVLYVPDVTAEPRVYYWTDISMAGRLVGFAPDGKTLRTAVREYNLVSGFHRLQAWRPEPQGAEGGEGAAPGGEGPAGAGAPGGGRLMQVASTDLEADQTYGYHFAPDGKTFRTVYQETKPSGQFGVLEVREVDTASGKTTKTLGRVEGEFTRYSLSGDGTRLATFDAKDTITLYDAESGKPRWKRTLKFEQPDVVAQGGPFGAGDRGDRSEMAAFHTLQLSPDGKRAVVTRGINPPIVLNAATGDMLPVPALSMMTAWSAGPGVFSADGRLLVMSGLRYTSREVRTKGPGGVAGVQTAFQSAGSCLTVWEVDTGKMVKSWDRSAKVRFLPNAPVLSVFEENGSGGTRLGLWDFTAEAQKK